MIITEITDSSPYGFNGGLRTKIQGTFLEPIPTENDNSICYCDIECEYIEEVFANVGGDVWENDKNSFLYKKYIAADTVTIKLYKDGVETATITDNTYGTYYSSFTAQPLYVGFVLEWEKVMNLLGAGTYQIKTTVVITGNSSVKVSHKFRLMAYSDEIANRTVKIAATQNGNIIGSEFDYSDLNWVWYYRIKGKLTKESPELEQDKYLASNYVVKQIQDKITRNWRLETGLLPAHVTNMLVEDNILANEFKVTDYNILNNDIYREVSLYVKNPPEVNNKAENRNSQINIDFTDKIDNLVKRNF